MDKTDAFDKVTIVISATDEGESLIRTVDSIVADCDIRDIALFLIVTPRRISEACENAVRQLSEKYPTSVRRFIQRNPYIGGAMRDSVEETQSSHIMFLSANIPVSLDCVSVMIREAKRTPGNIIKISRWLEKNSFTGYDRTRLILNFLAQKLLKMMFFSGLTDFTTPVLIAPTVVYRRILFKEWNFPCLLEAVIIPLRAGIKIREIPARCLPRTEGKSKNTWLQTLLYLKTALRVRFTEKSKLYKAD